VRRGTTTSSTPRAASPSERPTSPSQVPAPKLTDLYLNPCVLTLEKSASPSEAESCEGYVEEEKETDFAIAGPPFSSGIRSFSSYSSILGDI